MEMRKATSLEVIIDRPLVAQKVMILNGLIIACFILKGDA